MLQGSSPKFFKMARGMPFRLPLANLSKFLSLADTRVFCMCGTPPPQSDIEACLARPAAKGLPSIIFWAFAEHLGFIGMF